MRDGRPHSIAARCAAVALLALAAVACQSDDGAGATGNDDAGSSPDGALSAAVNINCPVGGPTAQKAQLGDCCYRTSNEERAEQPQFRMAALRITEPSTLTSLITAALVANAIDQDRLNWLIDLGEADDNGDRPVRTGCGERHEDGSYGFSSGGQALSYAPVDVQGRVTEDNLTTDAVAGPMTICIEHEKGEGMEGEIPIRQLEFARAEMSVDRNCIGERITSTFDTSRGELRGFVHWDDASVAMNGLGGITPARLCTFLLGKLTGAPGACEDLPQDEWKKPPDSLCTEDGCTEGGCDELTECNAWRITAVFAAQAVRIR